MITSVTDNRAQPPGSPPDRTATAAQTDPLTAPANAPTIYAVFSKVDTNADGIISGVENQASLRRAEQLKDQFKQPAEAPDAAGQPVPFGSFSALA